MRQHFFQINEDFVFLERYIVTGLLPNVAYSFKIEACNEAGLTSNSNKASETLTLTPSQGYPVGIPSTPRVLVTSTNSVSLEWDSNDDLASDEYTVLYKSEGSTVWNELNCTTTFCSIDGLKEGVSYVFKVAARNEAGVGTFSNETVPVKVTLSIPPVVTKAIKDVSVPKKRTLQLECHANAEPAPEYIWYKDGVEIIPRSANTEVLEFSYSKCKD
ncbi:fibronectin type III domain protein [Dictyocaulus viviparus]|uniref:Fibronectin type III domain protein n=1 Tax=Dictyocaulus viviparus TaxID=29172 RepID=A0A0D8XHT7_DICVI|nr:fibronectin type III domain protein [Dictyocaulus viviparus]